jgi:hypothetical protein
MTLNISEDDLEGMQHEWEYIQEKARGWVLSGLGSGGLWDKLSDISLGQMHDALEAHLGEQD